MTTVTERIRAVVIAGHRGDRSAAADGLLDDDDEVRAAALGALERCGSLTDAVLTAGFADVGPAVRRRAVELAALRPGTSLLRPLHDDDATVVEVAAWACGEHEDVDDPTIERLIELATEHETPLVRESAAAALGAIGDRRGLPAILTACADKPHVRRRAVLALAPFEGDEVEAAIDRALEDRDWQVRQAAEDLRRAEGAHEI